MSCKICFVLTLFYIAYAKALYDVSAEEIELRFIAKLSPFTIPPFWYNRKHPVLFLVHEQSCHEEAINMINDKSSLVCVFRSVCGMVIPLFLSSIWFQSFYYDIWGAWIGDWNLWSVFPRYIIELGKSCDRNMQKECCVYQVNQHVNDTGILKSKLFM